MAARSDPVRAARKGSAGQADVATSPGAPNTPLGSSAPAGPAASAPPSTGASSKDHSLSLKVMRLSKPSFQFPRLLPCEASDLGFAGVQAQRKQLPMSLPESVLSPHLMLPGSFGSIYLGETFSSYISLFNSSHHPVTALSMKVELRSASQQRYTLMEMAMEATDRFTPMQSHDVVVHHHVEEEGAHILICTANYIRHDGDKRFFRKYYKFVVENPFALASTVRRLTGEALLVEVKLKNTAKHSLMLDRADLTYDHDVYDITDYNRKRSEGGDEGESDDELEGIESRLAQATAPSLQVYMKPNDMRQLLYRLTPRVPNSPANAQPNIGRIQLRWHSTLGGTGSMVSAQVQAPPPPSQDVQLSITGVPGHVVVERPFTVQCEIRNGTRSAIHPHLYITVPLHTQAQSQPRALRESEPESTGIVVMGLNARALPRLPPGEATTTPLTLLPLKTGVQSLSWLQVVDQNQQTVFKFNNIAEIFVHDAASS